MEDIALDYEPANERARYSVKEGAKQEPHLAASEICEEYTQVSRQHNTALQQVVNRVKRRTLPL